MQLSSSAGRFSSCIAGQLASGRLYASSNDRFVVFTPSDPSSETRMTRKPPLKRLVGGDGVPGFVAYYRVSTDKQGASGLGLEAQQEAVQRHVRAAGGHILDVFQEIESGKRNDRPEIAAAIAACRARRATLIIAKLDRLARNVAFVSNLMEAGIEFVACDNPHATPC
jgi:hypothetical protein